MRLLFAIISIATSFAAGARADTKGVIGGRVTDSQNAAVSQAVVELTNDIDGRRQETFAYGSGLPDASDSLFGECVTKDCRLPAHAVLNLAFGKVFANRVEAKIEVENITNSVYAINLGSEFNGSHVSPPGLLTLRLSYRY